MMSLNEKTNIKKLIDKKLKTQLITFPTEYFNYTFNQFIPMKRQSCYLIHK
ncbi:hypothetical protein SAMN04487893_104129 [Myroides guanonis]|uniref:Uncharacterized protein n=1 Tax=Myroides guanonis TaxID=1150112 RepID=A0A1I3PHI8_9FLAO|nr:hypothetical protein SAMN04487893_104129 [Myroides guanonis]